MSTAFATRTLHEFPNPSVEHAWREGLRRVKLPAHYNSPEYFREPFWEGKRPFAVLAFDGETVVGVLTGLHERGEVWCGQPARPQICTAEGTDIDRVADSLARGLIEEAGPAKLVSVFSWAPLRYLGAYGFRLRRLEGDVVLDLSVGAEALFKNFHENRRRNTRSAIRHDVEVHPLATPEDVRAYYDVYQQWRRTPRKEIEWEEVPFESFQRALALTANRKVFLARHNGRIIAGINLRMYSGGLLEFAAGHAIEEHVRLRPNDLLHWRAIEWACSEGFAAYCLGGAHTFLRRFGGTVVPVYRHRLDRTFLRSVDLRESLSDIGRRLLRPMPAPVEKAARWILGKK